MNRRGFAYIIAVLILGLLAFMGLFLLQSSSAEYSSAAISVYRTMARQLAEGAADEAFVMLEERFRDKTDTGYFQQLLWQASTSTVPAGGGSTGLNPTLLHDFSDLKDQVTQTIALKDHFMTRAGFTIESIMPNIKDLRPIPQGPLDNPECYYSPPDRLDKFDNMFSRDWYMTLKVDVKVSLKKRRTITINYSESRDVKIINLGPIARNYTFFNIMGSRLPSDPAAIQGKLRQGMNSPDTPGGRLILWNQPFQSRIYMHGPAIIALENPELATDRPGWGAYNLGDPKKPVPGNNNAFQYSDTFFGFSYYPTIGRAIFPKKSMWDSISVWWRGGKETKNDMSANQTYYPGLLDHATVYGGILPHRGRGLLDIINDVSSGGIQDTYFRGTNIHQKFYPAGLYCRTPWKYVSPATGGEDRYLPNSKADFSSAVQKKFPKDDEFLRIEHRWQKGEPDVEKQNKIYARTYKIKYNNVTNNINDPPEEKLMEFALTYYNDPDPEGILGKLGYTLSTWGESMWNTFTMPFEAVAVLTAPIWNKFFPGSDKALTATLEDKVKNTFPTNFKFNMKGIVTRHLASVDDIPITDDKKGRWNLNGVYWLDSFQTDRPVTYVGTGTIVVTRYDSSKPFRIGGSIVAARDPSTKVPLGHLNIIYNPKKSATPDVSDRAIQIVGSGVTIEASVYSLYGIKTDAGNIADFGALGVDASKPMGEWGNFIPKVMSRTNVIAGNYINAYMCKEHQKGDLWIIHDITSPLYFDKVAANNYQIVQKRIDSTKDSGDAERKKYEIMTHEFFMSPVVQHVAVIGSSN